MSEGPTLRDIIDRIDASERKPIRSDSMRSDYDEANIIRDLAYSSQIVEIKLKKIA